MDAVYAQDSVQLDMLLQSTDKQDLDFVIDGWSPLTAAISTGYKNMAEQFLNAGASVDFPSTFGKTPLMVCATKGHTAIACLLLDRGADVRRTANDKFNFERTYTALHYAARYGQYETAAVLLKHGAELLEASILWGNFEDLPICDSISFNHPQLMTLFLDQYEEHESQFSLQLFKYALSISIDNSNEKCASIILEYVFPDAE